MTNVFDATGEQPHSGSEAVLSANATPRRYPSFAWMPRGWSAKSFPNLISNKRGGVSVIGVFLLVSIIGISAFSVELGQGHLIKIQYQGAADAAALAAANADVVNNGDSILTVTAQDVVLANGLPMKTSELVD